MFNYKAVGLHTGAATSSGFRADPSLHNYADHPASTRVTAQKVGVGAAATNVEPTNLGTRPPVGTTERLVQR